ncbi:hypothetical protein OHS18_42055 [Amycolatopsis sp. NBC_00355]|uniref:hypothetical protein n=1 Tax=Amycolatopsis sp. NBC_00355 TaxID=2975957 RepID=UPI002E257D11
MQKKRMRDDMLRGRLRMIVASLALVAALYVSLIDVWLIRGWWHLTGIVFLIFFAWWLRSLRHAPSLEDRELGKPQRRQPRLRDIEAAAQYVQAKYGTEAIAYFQNVLSNLASYLVRVDQEVHVDGRELRTSITLSFRYDRPNEKTLDEDEKTKVEEVSIATEVAPKIEIPPELPYECTLLPLVTARKGLMFDRFGAYSQSGAPLSLLSQYEVRGLLATTVQALFKRHLVAHVEDLELDKDRSQVIKDVMDDVIVNAVCFVGNTPTDQSAASEALDLRKDVLKDIEDRLRAWPTLFSKATLEQITQVCKALAYNYVIAAEVPRPKTRNFLVKYEHEVTSDLMNHSSEEHLRARLGLEPVTIDVPVSRALQADSFHLQVKAPAGQYVFDHHLEKLGSKEAMSQGDFRDVLPTPPYVRLYHKEGRSIAHLYVRRQGEHPSSLVSAADRVNRGADRSSGKAPLLTSFKSVIRFREIPPGSLSAVALLSGLTTVLVGFFTISRAGLSGVGFQAAPALILALPAFLASGMGRGVDGKGIARSSLTVSIALAVVCFNSLISVLMYILGSVQKLHGEVDVTLPFPLHGVVLHTDAWWLLLLAWSLATTVCAYREKRAQTSYYLGMIAKVAVDNEKRSFQNEEDIK